MNTLAAYYFSLVAALLISLFLFEIGESMQVQALNAGLFAIICWIGGCATVSLGWLIAIAFNTMKDE